MLHRSDMWRFEDILMRPVLMSRVNRVWRVYMSLPFRAVTEPILRKGSAKQRR